MGNRFEMRLTNKAIGFCAGPCGRSLKGEGIEIGPAPWDTMCLDCASELTRLVLAREDRVAVPASSPRAKQDA